MTSLTFMFVCVPLPVCQTASGKLPSSEPSRISWQVPQSRRHGAHRAHRAAHSHARGGSFYDRERADNLGGIRCRCGNFQSQAASARPSNGRQVHAPRPSCHAPDGIPSCNLFSLKSQTALLYAHLPAHRKPTTAKSAKAVRRRHCFYQPARRSTQSAWICPASVS